MEIFDSSVGNKQTEEFYSSTAPQASSGSVPKSHAVAFSPAFSSPITKSQTSTDLASPVMSILPDLSSVQNHEKHIMTMGDKEGLMQRNCSLLHNDSSVMHGKSEFPTLPVFPISAMNELLLQSHSLPCPAVCQYAMWSM
ncbi:hypothetical protein ACH5RR_039678 [Cinchona calisaya]|uniref:Uncharacterized protein n=1 Tax=Cinchona calisaya TaxID=153742 RepID=A0ABD2Y1L0_9GENT